MILYILILTISKLTQIKKSRAHFIILKLWK